MHYFFACQLLCKSPEVFIGLPFGTESSMMSRTKGRCGERRRPQKLEQQGCKLQLYKLYNLKHYKKLKILQPELLLKEVFMAISRQRRTKHFTELAWNSAFECISQNTMLCQS